MPNPNTLTRVQTPELAGQPFVPDGAQALGRRAMEGLITLSPSGGELQPAPNGSTTAELAGPGVEAATVSAEAQAGITAEVAAVGAVAAAHEGAAPEGGVLARFKSLGGTVRVYGASFQDPEVRAAQKKLITGQWGTLARFYTNSALAGAEALAPPIVSRTLRAVTRPFKGSLLPEAAPGKTGTVGQAAAVVDRLASDIGDTYKNAQAARAIQTKAINRIRKEQAAAKPTKRSVGLAA